MYMYVLSVYCMYVCVHMPWALEPHTYTHTHTHTHTHAPSKCMQDTTYNNNMLVHLGPTFEGSIQHGVNDRVNVLIHVTKQEGKAKLDGNLEMLQKVRVVERTHLE